MYGLISFKSLFRVVAAGMLVSVLIIMPGMLRSDTAGIPDLQSILEQECINLNKGKLLSLLQAQFELEITKGLSSDFLKIVHGVVKRTDFDGIAEEKTAEIIGLVQAAHAKGAPLEYLDEIFDVAYVNTISVEQLFAAANALKEFDNSDVPRDVYEEFVYHSIENGWDPAVVPTLTRGLIYGTDRGLSPHKVALIIMLDVKNQELRKKSADQLVLDAIKLVREKEPGNWKPLSAAEQEADSRMKRRQSLESRQRDLDENIGQKERAVRQAEEKLRELREYPVEQDKGIDAARIQRDMEELIRSLHMEMQTFERQRGSVVAELEKTRKAMEAQQAVKDQERRQRRERELANLERKVASSGRSGRLNHVRLNAAVDRYIGVPYRYGGDSERGIDCSAFTRRVYREQGVELPRSSREQARVGMSVNYTAVKTGDLIFFDASIQNRISHVGVYLGDGVFAHASSSRGVTKSSLRQKYYVKRFVKGGRIFYD